MLTFSAPRSEIRTLTDFVESPRHMGGESSGIIARGDLLLFCRSEDSVVVYVYDLIDFAKRGRFVAVRPTPHSPTRNGLDTPGPWIDRVRNRIAVVSTADPGTLAGQTGQAAVRSWAPLAAGGWFDPDAVWTHDPHATLLTVESSEHMGLLPKRSGPTEFSVVDAHTPDGGQWLFFDAHGRSSEWGEWKLMRAHVRNLAGKNAPTVLIDPPFPVWSAARDMPKGMRVPAPFHPFVTRGPDGHLYMAHLGGKPWRADVHVSVSKDEGYSWSHVRMLADWNDLGIDDTIEGAHRTNSPWVAFDQRRSRILVGCTIARRNIMYREQGGNEAVMWEVPLG